MRLLCLGYGYVARRLGLRLMADGWAVAGTTRDPGRMEGIAGDGAEPVLWSEEGICPAALGRASAILVSAPPDDEGCPALRAFGDALASLPRSAAWIGYLSSNGVYGDHGGAWVEERSPLHAKSRRALNRIAAERQWAELADRTGTPLAVFRLPGIYGPGRSALDAVREGRAQRIVKPGQVFNRAHVDDIAAALASSIERPDAGALFNIADDEPSPPQDVVEFACALLGVEPPPAIPFGESALSEMARSFYADNKRVSNALMKARLVPRLQHPTYREGLSAVLEEERRLIPRTE